MVRQLVFLKNQLIRYATAVWPGLTSVFRAPRSAQEVLVNYGTRCSSWPITSVATTLRHGEELKAKAPRR